MRVRRKKNCAVRIAACAHLLITSPESLKADPSAPFGVTRPIYIEIGCGKGAFACGLAVARPDVNLIALERVPDVVCLALERAVAESDKRQADNLRFIIGDAQKIGEWLPEGSVEYIYLNFSDPWPKKRHVKRRLTHPEFIKIYKRLLVPGGRLIMKTDNVAFFEFSLEQFAAEGFEVIRQTRDLGRSPYAAGNIMTEYERSFTERGVPVCMAETVLSKNA